MALGKRARQLNKVVISGYAIYVVLESCVQTVLHKKELSFEKIQNWLHTFTCYLKSHNSNLSSF